MNGPWRRVNRSAAAIATMFRKCDAWLSLSVTQGKVLSLRYVNLGRRPGKQGDEI